MFICSGCKKSSKPGMKPVYRRELREKEYTYARGYSRGTEIVREQKLCSDCAEFCPDADVVVERIPGQRGRVVHVDLATAPDGSAIQITTPGMKTYENVRVRRENVFKKLAAEGK